MKYRFENFGGIVAGNEPPFLAFVDRRFMRNIGAGESPLWDTEDESVGILSAPTEVHFAATNACAGECPHCYMNAGRRDPGELDTESFKRALAVLADMGVFHVALGGGDALLRPDIFEIAEHVRNLEMVPNLTITGATLTPEIAERIKAYFGQVNLSLDGVGALSGTYRGKDVFSEVDRAFGILIKAGVSTGINCVVGRRNYSGIDRLFAYAAETGLNEIEFLRLKPSGRARENYLAERTTYEQNLDLLPNLSTLSEKYGIRAKIDCSFVPMLCRTKPPIEILESLAVYGCEAGNVLLGIRSNGMVAGCSFLNTSGQSVFDLKDTWRTDPNLISLRTWPERAAEPCRSCDYLRICKGGCRAVAAHVSGNLDAPDPDCPFVVEY